MLVFKNGMSVYMVGVRCRTDDVTRHLTDFG